MSAYDVQLFFESFSSSWLYTIKKCKKDSEPLLNVVIWMYRSMFIKHIKLLEGFLDIGSSWDGDAIHFMMNPMVDGTGWYFYYTIPMVSEPPRPTPAVIFFTPENMMTVHFLHNVHPLIQYGRTQSFKVLI